MVSKTIKEKAFRLFKTGKVKKELETSRRIHFSVIGETEEHHVIFDKLKKTFDCDCRYFSVKGKICSHILACRLYLRVQ